ncbi:MAG: hypothetical protein ACYSWP_02255, partial [Planctomycetota bacterium]
MRKLVLVLLLIIIVIAVILLLPGGLESEMPLSNPELLNVGTSEVTIGWKTEQPIRAKIEYLPAGSEQTAMRAEQIGPDSLFHEIVIRGLEPGRRYSYRAEGSKSRFQFQTQPLGNNPFSFLVVWGDVRERLMSLMTSEMPEFIINLTEPSGGSDVFTNVRPYVPVYNLSGLDSPYLRSMKSETIAESSDLWKLDWAGLRLVFVRDLSQLQSLFDNSVAHTFGVVTYPHIVEAFGKKVAADPNEIAKLPLHSILSKHNSIRAAQPVSFVAVVGSVQAGLIVDNIRYFGIPSKSEQTGAIRIDVDVESVAGYFLAQNREIALKQAPLKQRRTCEQCRRLADKGSYEESVKAYQEFIENNQGHFQIDDAYFAIAEIFDEKLFRFEDALVWYLRLVTEYADSTLTPLARQRIKYIERYRDNDYIPLSRFE